MKILVIEIPETSLAQCGFPPKGVAHNKPWRPVPIRVNIEFSNKWHVNLSLPLFTVHEIEVHG